MIVFNKDVCVVIEVFDQRITPLNKNMKNMYSIFARPAQRILNYLLVSYNHFVLYANKIYVRFILSNIRCGLII